MDVLGITPKRTPRPCLYPLRRELRKHPRGGVDEERADQGDVFKDREHLMGNIEFAKKNS